MWTLGLKKNFSKFISTEEIPEWDTCEAQKCDSSFDLMADVIQEISLDDLMVPLALNV